MNVRRFTPAEWNGLSEKAHLVVFCETKPADWDRIDYALVTEDETGLRTYATCREISHDTLYWQYGGAFPGTRGTTKIIQDMKALLLWIQERYTRLCFFVENTNAAMLKLAMRFGFQIVGIRNFRGAVLLEHLLEWERT